MNSPKLSMMFGKNKNSRTHQLFHSPENQSNLLNLHLDLRKNIKNLVIL